MADALDPALMRTSATAIDSHMLDEGLLSAVRGVTEAEMRVVVTVAMLRYRGRSWAYIGDLLGVSRQAVWERFHHYQGMP